MRVRYGRCRIGLPLDNQDIAANEPFGLPDKGGIIFRIAIGGQAVFRQLGGDIKVNMKPGAVNIGAQVYDPQADHFIAPVKIHFQGLEHIGVILLVVAFYMDLSLPGSFVATKKMQVRREFQENNVR